MASEFVGERIEPVPGTFDASRMARGEPGLPRRFLWRGTEHEVAEVLESGRSTGDCTHGSGEQYVRKHWYRVRTTAGVELRITFNRDARTPREMRDGWWIQSMTTSDAASAASRAPAAGARP